MLSKWKGDLMKTDVDYLRSISKVKGELTWHIRNAVNSYVKKLQLEDKKNGRKHI